MNSDLKWLAHNVSKWVAGYPSVSVIMRPHGKFASFRKDLEGDFNCFEWLCARDDEGLTALNNSDIDNSVITTECDLETFVQEAYGALKEVNKIIAEGASEGFNCHNGDWAERLFHSQRATSRFLKKIEKGENL